MPMPPLRVKAVVGGLLVLLGVGAGVSASAAAPAGPAVQLDRSAVTVADDDTVTVAVHLDRGASTGPATLTVKNLPSQTTVSFSPAATIAGSDATLRLVTGRNAALGVHRVRVVATIRKGPGVDARTVTVSATLTLTVVREVYTDFAITGTADRDLAPGVTALLDLRITNPHTATLKLLRVQVTVAGTSKPGCGAANYATTGYNGPIVRIPPHSSRTLRELGVTTSALPTVGMKNLATNQDRCHGVTVTLAFNGSGRGRS